MAKDKKIWRFVDISLSSPFHACLITLSLTYELCVCTFENLLHSPLSALGVLFSWIIYKTGDIILYDGRLAVYKHSLDLIFYLIANQDENELMISTALSAFSDAVHMLLRNQVEKRAVLENLDLVLLCLDETIDEGCVASIHFPYLKRHRNEPFSNVLSLWLL
jgi:hypothetical protein